MKNISKIVEAIYYYDKPKVFRPNRDELDHHMFNCPKCKSQLSLPRQRSLNQLYVCPSCNFKSPYENVLNSPDQIEEYMLENKKKKKVIDNIVNEAMVVNKFITSE